MANATKKKGNARRVEPLGRRAKAPLRKSPQRLSPTPVEDVQRLVHELQVHQAELEMQNEELRRVQSELEISRDRFARLYDLAPVGYLTLDAEGVIQEANLTASRLLGLDRQALLKKKLSNFVTAKSQDDFYLHRRQVFTNANLQTCDLQMRRPDGAAFSGRLESVVETAEPGRPTQYLVALSDVTRLLRAEALRQSEANYRSLFELNPAPMWICAEDTLEFLDANEAALRLYGWSHHAFLRMTAKDIRPPEDVPEFVRHMNQKRGSRAAFVGERHHLKRDGSVFDVAVTISSIPYAGRAAWLAVVNDVTDRKRAEEALKRLNATLERRVAERTQELRDAYERHRAITDNALVGILTLNKRGLVETLNPAAAQIFGYAPAELAGSNVSRLMASPAQAQGEEFLADYRLPGNQRFTAVGREVLGRRKDGRAIMLGLTVSGFTQGGRRRYIVMVSDITERKRLERELLEVSERERRQLGHDIHDGLGQHLHGLAYLAELLHKGLHEEASPRAAEAGRLNRYLTEALEMTRNLARGLQPVDAVPQGLMLALRDLAERTRGVYRVDCQFECPAPVLIHRHTAANHLYRIAQEAVNNAMKHGKPTRVRIKLAATAQRIVLGVRDNGVGIRRRTKTGRGMGLHVMQHRADAIGGSLLVQRHPEGGTDVVCTVRRQALLPQENHLK